jgi:uroporphyrin-III C-methyltransferase
MSARTFADMLPKLIAAGLDPATPALAVSASTTPRSKHVACPVTDLPTALANAALQQPCLILVGNGVAQSCDSVRDFAARVNRRNTASPIAPYVAQRSARLRAGRAQ